ncbi:MAG: hypothetical protein JNK04_08540, partial [Myxococcales bacterium]|nr:hypothetical protein [Myxococcales bacterium]
MIRREATSNPGPKPPSCEDIDLDGLVYRELSPVDELIARSHIAACPPCRREHDELVAEHRAFAARARASEPAPLPSFDQLMARAPAPPTGLGARWRALVE